MRTAFLRRFLVGALVITAAVVLGLPALHRPVHAQGYSLSSPNVAATGATGLGLTYTGGSVVSGGAVQAITGSTLTATDAQTTCAAPAFSSCNFVYWHTGTGLSITTTLATATVPGNVMVAYVTTTGGNITVVTPASWSGGVPTGGSASATDRFFQVNPTCAFTPTTTAADSGTWPTQEFITAGQTTLYSYQTNSTGGTVEVTCAVPMPASRTTAGTGITLNSIDVNYNIVTTTLTTFANPILASLTGPATAGGSATGTVSTTAGGSLTFTPSTIQKTAVASGLMYRLNMALGTPIALNSGITSYIVDFILTTAGTTKTKIQLYPFTLYTAGA